MKPVAASCGRGIIIVNDDTKDRIKWHKPYVAQKYIANPAMVQVGPPQPAREQGGTGAVAAVRV